MPEDNHNGNQREIVRNASACNSLEVIEFNWPLYVYQRPARDGEEYLFTIAVWKGTRLLPICHLQPFQTALEALGEALIKTGRSQLVSTASAGSDSDGVNTGRNATERAKSLSSADDHGQP